MTAQEAIDYIEQYTWSTTRLGLDRTRELLKKLGDPQKKLKFIHVAGSNGKGSTCAMLSAIARAAGYRTGLYTSPYIQDFCERMQVDGQNVPGEVLAEITERVKAIADAMADHPSQFELVTAIALEYFYEAKCDIVVLEVGMGGALDSTNAIDAPEVAVITNIGLEHTEYLGDTLEAIAATKAGIIKPGCHAVCYDGAPEVTEVVKAVCAEKKVPLRCVDFARMEPVAETLAGQTFRWDGKEKRVALLGPHQLHNTATVLETVEALRERGWAIPDAAVDAGLAAVQWPARLEVLRQKPLFLLDGGHNPQCAEALAAAIEKLLPGQKVVFLLGVLADKDYPQILDIVAPYAKKFICLTPFSDRALPARKLAEFLKARGLEASACGSDVARGIRAAEKAAGRRGAVVAFGSLYLAGHVRGVFQEMYPAE
ncbi:MAG: bifunctional folylpolyglutamate synthase/dihydrofolate synthase [Ruminococcaceae bacterium]|nr:bifunctional folylpolyglutamate synthase/dihydrofolate synthase [Oscillospiraceae bacterium]